MRWKNFQVITSNSKCATGKVLIVPFGLKIDQSFYYLLAVMFMIFTLAALGLPGTSGFIGEILILMGAFQKSILVAILASLGVIFSAVYMLWLYKRVIFGKIKNNELKKIYDLNKTEVFIFSSLAFTVIFFGFYPEPLFKTIDISISELIKNYEINLSYHLAEVAR